MMESPWIAALAALFLWWFSTGAILWAVRRAELAGPQGPAAATLLGLPLYVGGAWGVAASLGMADIGGVYLAFASALAVWGWIELAFLTGIVTGPNRAPCPGGLSLWPRFTRAVGTIAWHETLLAGTLAVLAWVSLGAANPFAFWTFAVLFAARISAKLNLFLGVPRINTAFLPAALSHLPSHFRHAQVTPFFALSVTLLTAAAAAWTLRLLSAPTAAGQAGFALIAALTALALVEHWMMVLRLPDDRLWRWMLPAPDPDTARTYTKDEAHGL